MKKFFMMLAFAFCALVSFTACNENDEPANEPVKVEQGVTVTDSQIIMKYVDASGATTVYTFDFDADGICIGGKLVVTYMGIDSESTYDICNGMTKEQVKEIMEETYKSLTQA